MDNKKNGLFLRFWKWLKELIFGKKEVKNEISNKGGKITNSPQTVGDKNTNINIINNQDCNINVYNNFPTKETFSSPHAIIVEKEKKDQGEKLKKEEITIKQNPKKNNEQPEEKQEMSQQEFERLLMKTKFITFGIMGNIKWDKVKPLEFRKREGNKEGAQLIFEVEKRRCFIEFLVSKEDKEKFLTTNTFKLVESFILQQLVSYGKNGYLGDKCPDCKQTTLTKTTLMNDPNEEVIACNLCGWAGFMDNYNKYLNDKKHNPFLEFPEWLEKHNNPWSK